MVNVDLALQGNAAQSARHVLMGVEVEHARRDVMDAQKAVYLVLRTVAVKLVTHVASEKYMTPTPFYDWLQPEKIKI